MVFHTFHTTKKTFYYNFFPTKAEEEDLKARGAPTNGRVLVEMRDIYPPPMLDPNYPWMIKKTINLYEIASGKLVLSHNDAFEHVLRYWSLGMANYIAMGQKVGVALWDVTEEGNIKKYQGNDVYLQMIANDDCVVACMDMIKERKLKVGDRVSLFWDPKETTFQFKLIV
ncbi:hypothetical protein BUALT_Bualt15G0130700 [Buddleja alternifolia]|uniref:Uncharacterized protein n=1 Tax=Buddleja alternifolia TaxID=168488 RepID=A0AAV6WLE2_9LAMI|nr:hypothetical protein BUALT_Bualt15G0130700 [Buddleja alternifolia]